MVGLPCRSYLGEGAAGEGVGQLPAVGRIDQVAQLRREETTPADRHATRTHTSVIVVFGLGDKMCCVRV
jgi:hypothetical protein